MHPWPQECRRRTCTGHADELMCMKWCALSHTADIHKYTVARTMFCNETPVKDAIKNRLHHVAPLRSCAWCVASGARAVVHRWFSCFMILSGHKELIQIRLHHAHQRMRSRTTDCTTLKKASWYYSLFFHFVCSIILGVYFLVLIRIVLKQWVDSYDDRRHVLRMK